MEERFSKCREKYFTGNNSEGKPDKGKIYQGIINRIDWSPEWREILAAITFKYNHVNSYSQTILSPITEGLVLHFGSSIMAEIFLTVLI